MKKLLSALLALTLAFSVSFGALTAQASGLEDLFELLDLFGDMDAYENYDEDDWYGDYGDYDDYGYGDEEDEGPIIEPQAIADYLFEHGELPENFITKKEAQALGWDSSRNYVSDVAPGYSIGGDRFGNYEGLLPKKKGRQYYECDCYYTEGKRSAYRIVYSNDGLVYYTEDHYNSFTQMYPSK